MSNSLEENEVAEEICFQIENSSEKDDLIDGPNSNQSEPCHQKNKRRGNDAKMAADTGRHLSSQKQFDDFLIEAIDETLTTLGESVKRSFYQHLEKDFSMPKTKIPERVNEFTCIIHKIFGLGACRLEIKIMKNLSSKIQADFNLSECECTVSKWIVTEISFKDQIKKFRNNYEMKSAKRS